MYHRGAARSRADVYVMQDGTARRTQVLLMTDAEAVDWLTATKAEAIRPRAGHGTGTGGDSHDSPSP
ncbi:hypothetical protein [Streptomyces sp. NPDC058622]|uniref:hypothetical protein n=1 Tax=Streptomyces sp. NPDC058622 TaxID=3346562 RepID=UPI00365841F5